MPADQSVIAGLKLKNQKVSLASFFLFFMGSRSARPHAPQKAAHPLQLDWRAVENPTKK
jgi:hypothetical protein